MCIGLNVKYALFLSDFNETWIFSREFLKRIKYQFSWKSVQWWPSDSVPMDRQTDITKLTVIFRNSADAPKISHCFEEMLRLLLQAVHEIWHVIRRHGIRDLSSSHRRCWSFISSGMWCYYDGFVFSDVSIHLLLYPEDERTAACRNVNNYSINEPRS